MKPRRTLPTHTDAATDIGARPSVVPSAKMVAHYSGILVVVPPAQVDRCRAALDDLAGVEVRHAHPESGRIVVVHESRNLDEQTDRLRQIRSIPNVLLAELVYHYVDSNALSVESAAARNEQERR